MAKVGLRNFLFGILTEELDGSASYGVAQKPAKAISCTVDISNNDVKLYGDDAVAESDTSFQSGTVTMGIDRDDPITMATLLGHEIQNGVMVRNAMDVAPYVGLGRVITEMVDGAYKFRVEFLKKVKFSEGSQSNDTRGESVEFGTYELSGQVSTLANGDWSESAEFDTMDEAMTFLESFFGAGTSATVSFNANGGTGSYNNISTYVGAIINVPDGSALTPPTDKHFVGWDSTSTATNPDVVGTYKVTGTVTLYAIYADD